MTDSVRLAFCPLLFHHNGGTFKDGKPVFGSDKRTYVRGRCDVAHDCGECTLLSAWVKSMEDHVIVGWECSDCLRETKDLPRSLPGYFQASRYRDLITERVLVEPERPLDGCTRCGKGTSFLQLVLRQK